MSKWFWNNDDGWVEYDQKTSKKLEDGFVGGLTEVKVDDQRFVQFVNKNKLKENFIKISPKDLPSCVGIQRRYDNEMKRRVVKREAPCNKTLFAGLTFCICTGRKKPMLKSKEGKELEDAVKEFGGSCVKDFSKNPDYIVMKAGDTFSLDEVNQAQVKGHVVNENFIQYCVKYDKILDFKKFSKVDTELTSDDEEEMNKIDGDDDDVETDDDSTNNDDKKDDEKPISSPPPKKVAKTDTTPSTDTDKIPALKIEANGTFVGSCIYIQTNENFPLNITVLSVNGINFEGVVTWTTINNAQTKCRGSIDENGAFKLEEYAVIVGEDDIEVPSSYDGKVIGNSVNGVVTSSKETTSFFLVYKNPQHPLDKLRGGATFSGVFKFEVPYTISMKPGDSDIAIIKYSTAVGEFATEARVAKKDNGLSVNEFAEVPGSISKNVPRSYVLAPSGSDDELNGTVFVPNYATGATTNYGTASLSLK